MTHSGKSIASAHKRFEPDHVIVSLFMSYFIVLLFSTSHAPRSSVNSCLSLTSLVIHASPCPHFSPVVSPGYTMTFHAGNSVLRRWCLSPTLSLRYVSPFFGQSIANYLHLYQIIGAYIINIPSASTFILSCLRVQRMVKNHIYYPAVVFPHDWAASHIARIGKFLNRAFKKY